MNPCAVVTQNEFVLAPSTSMSRRQFVDAVEAAIAHGRKRILVDCSNWQDLDLLMLSTLLRCAHACQSQRALLQLTNVRDDIADRIIALRITSPLQLTDAPRDSCLKS